jgi:RNA polymerase sigma-70 factor (ECF subfamily)
MSIEHQDPEHWVEQYGDALYQYAIVRVRDSDRTEDLVQETFLAGIRNRHSFDGRSSLLTWLTAILKHKIQDFYRTKWRETSVSDLRPEGAGEEWSRAFFDDRGHWNDRGPGEWVSPGQALRDAEFLAVLEGCLRKMPGRLATVFTMRELDQVDSEQVCKELGITSTNFWAMMHRARVRLRACLELNWFEDGKEGDDG